MKRFLLSALLISLILFGYTQVPNAINYQAVARNNAGVALANQNISIRLSVLDAGLEPLYKETRSVTTNLLGLFNVQIGSPGASNVLGTLQEIAWGSSGNLFLKVELDINNSGLFSEMGMQQLITVPFAFAAREAAAAKSLTGFPLLANTTPAIGDKLRWNGTAWAPVRNDTIIANAGNINAVPATPAGNPPWIFLEAPSAVTKQVTIFSNVRSITAMGVAVLGTSSNNTTPISVSMCYQNINGGEITPFFPNNFTDATVAVQPSKTMISAVGSITLPAGTYRIGMAIRNKSTSINLGSNDYQNTVIDIRY